MTFCVGVNNSTQPFPAPAVETKDSLDQCDDTDEESALKDDTDEESIDKDDNNQESTDKDDKDETDEESADKDQEGDKDEDGEEKGWLHVHCALCMQGYPMSRRF